MITITNNIYVGSNGSGKTFQMMNYAKELQNNYIPFIFLTTIEETLNIQNDVYEVFTKNKNKLFITEDFNKLTNQKSIFFNNYDITKKEIIELLHFASINGYYIFLDKINNKNLYEEFYNIIKTFKKDNDLLGVSISLELSLYEEKEEKAIFKLIMLDYSFDKILVSNNELKENLCYTNSLFSRIDYKFSKYIEEKDYQFKDMEFYDLKKNFFSHYFQN